MAVDAVHDPGRWIPGESWAKALTRNLLRTSLVLFTALLSGLVPHFALLSGAFVRSTDLTVLDWALTRECALSLS
jgi:hypothetical protein